MAPFMLGFIALQPGPWPALGSKPALAVTYDLSSAVADTSPGRAGSHMLEHLRTFLVAAAALTLGQALAFAGQPATAGRVMLASVLDPSGQPTVDVGADDFVIEEGNDDREILAVRVADYPVAVLLDNGSESETNLAAIKQAAARFIARIGQRPVAVGTLAQPAEIVASFDDERERVLENLAIIAAAPTRALTPLAAVTNVATIIRETGTPFSAVIVVSARAVDPSEQTASERFTPILESGAAVHVVTLRPAGLPPEAGADLLKELASQTKGQHIPIYTPASYAVALDRLADRLATEIMIDYLVPGGSVAREARVGVKIPGARVTALGVSK